MFSLCSNSIESRFRSILWGCFYTDTGLQLNPVKKQGQNKNGFAALMRLFFLAMLVLGSNFCINSIYTQNQIHKKRFSESRGTNFVGSLVDTRSVKSA